MILVFLNLAIFCGKLVASKSSSRQLELPEIGFLLVYNEIGLKLMSPNVKKALG